MHNASVASSGGVGLSQSFVSLAELSVVSPPRGDGNSKAEPLAPPVESAAPAEVGDEDYGSDGGYPVVLPEPDDDGGYPADLQQPPSVDHHEDLVFDSF